MKIQFETWSTGDYFLGLAWGQDEWSLELHLVKFIVMLKFRPIEEAHG